MSLSCEILQQVSSAKTAAEAWAGIEGFFASQSRAKLISTRMALATASKGTSTIAEYFTKMKALADEMAAAGRHLEDEEMVSYILTGLDEDYDTVVTGVANRAEPISLGELYTQLISRESRLEMRGGGSSSSANLASRGGNFNRGRGGFSRGGGNGGRGNQRGGGRNNNNNRDRAPFQPGLFCQVCGKEGHPAYRCFKRFDKSVTGPPQKSVSAATSSPTYGVNTNWYMDSGATDHITGELEKLSVHDRYHGGDHVHAANGSGMEISHVGHSMVQSHSHKIHLNNNLHVPDASKSLVSVNRLTRDNNAFVEFHPDHFSIKEAVTKKVLLRGKAEGGLYPIRPSLHQPSTQNKQAFGVVKPSTSVWHSRLGHASSSVVHRVLSRHNLPFVQDESFKHICDSCQKGKSHQLPYPKSTSVSTSVLDLVFSDVWGPAPPSVGRSNYYVSFIDDYSKFTWIYLLHHKSEVFQCFRDFQSLVERQFNKKIRAIQTDWGGEYRSLNSFFNCIGIHHLVSCPHAHQQNGSAERKHRHIVEMGITLLAHASMPLKFWGEAFIAPVFLITDSLPRLSTMTPLFIVSMGVIQITRSSTRLGVPYGLIFVLIINTHKLQFCSKKCVFIGYSNSHKGFKCLDPSDGRVYISRDVVFDETVFPFATLHPNAGARLQAELQVLPEVLLNPSMNFGDALIHDQHLSSLTNGQPSVGTSALPVGSDPKHSGEISQPNDAPMAPYRMCRGPGGSTDSQVDPSTVSGSDSLSTSGSVPLQSSGSTSSTASGSSAASAPMLTTSALPAAAQPDPVQGESSTSPDGDGVTAGSDVPPAGSGEDSVAMATTDSSSPPRRVTRLQHGISKPKQFTDGTVRWGML